MRYDEDDGCVVTFVIAFITLIIIMISVSTAYGKGFREGEKHQYETTQQQAVACGRAYYFLDKDHNRQFRWNDEEEK